MIVQSSKLGEREIAAKDFFLDYRKVGRAVVHRIPLSSIVSFVRAYSSTWIVAQTADG